MRPHHVQIDIAAVLYVEEPRFRLGNKALRSKFGWAANNAFLDYSTVLRSLIALLVLLNAGRV